MQAFIDKIKGFTLPAWVQKIADLIGKMADGMKTGAGGSPTSLHMDRNNPAVDVVGSASQLDALYRQLAAVGGRQLLWRVPGHYDHLHYADQGGVFKGPGMVWMGAGHETFASGLAAKKVANLPTEP